MGGTFSVIFYIEIIHINLALGMLISTISKEDENLLKSLTELVSLVFQTSDQLETWTNKARDEKDRSKISILNFPDAIKIGFDMYINSSHVFIQ